VAWSESEAADTCPRKTDEGHAPEDPAGAGTDLRCQYLGLNFEARCQPSVAKAVSAVVRAQQKVARDEESPFDIPSRYLGGFLGLRIVSHR